jgi:uncharacterized membrane protein
MKEEQMSARSGRQNAGSAPGGGDRLGSIDALRGLIIVLMALDHANYFVANQHSTGEHWGGPFPTYTSTFAFLTRFVTHLCAPGFFALMGAGMILFAESRRGKGWTEWALIRHFTIRGGLLIALQFILINRAWELGPNPFPPVYIGVLAALGGAMILGGFMLRLSPAHLVALTLALFIGTELLHPDPGMWGAITNDPLNLSLLRSGGDGRFWSNYPVLPWLELVPFGMLLGHWLARGPDRAYRRSLALGLLFLIAFTILRTLEGFGNIRPRMGDSWIDILNVVKYPPSMAFTLLTMGMNLLLLGAFSRAESRAGAALGILKVFGRAPLFVYIVHLFLYMGIGRVATPGGTSIAAMYPFWILGLLVLYPLARWYGKRRARSAPRSLLRLL